MSSSHGAEGNKEETNLSTVSEVPRPRIVSENGIKLSNNLDLYKNPLIVQYKLYENFSQQINWLITGETGNHPVLWRWKSRMAAKTEIQRDFLQRK